MQTPGKPHNRKLTHNLCPPMAALLWHEAVYYDASITMSEAVRTMMRRMPRWRGKVRLRLPAGHDWLFRLLNDGRGERVLEGDGDAGTLTDIVYQGWPETRDARAGFVPNAWINDSSRTCFEKFPGQLL